MLTWAQPALFQPDTLAAENPWTQHAFPHRDSSFQFAIMADLTGGYRDGVLPEAVQKANAIAPDFILSVGDLIEGYTMDTAQILRWWKQFDGWVNQLRARFFQHATFSSSRADIDTVLAAGSEWAMPLYLTASKNLRGSEQPPLELHWTISEQAEGRQRTQSGNYEIGIVPLRACSAAPAKVVIDGRWDEWGQPEWVTPAELGYPNGKQLRIGFSPGDSTLVDVKTNWPEEARIASRRNEKGSTAEIILPRVVLEDLNDGPFERFQLQWIVYDHDEMEDQYKGTKAYWLKPQPGSGTYIIEP